MGVLRGVSFGGVVGNAAIRLSLSSKCCSEHPRVTSLRCARKKGVGSLLQHALLHLSNRTALGRLRTRDTHPHQMHCLGALSKSRWFPCDIGNKVLSKNLSLTYYFRLNSCGCGEIPVAAGNRSGCGIFRHVEQTSLTQPGWPTYNELVYLKSLSTIPGRSESVTNDEVGQLGPSEYSSGWSSCS